MIAVRRALLYDRVPEKWKIFVQLWSVKNYVVDSTSELESLVKFTIVEILTELPATCHDCVTNFLYDVYIDSYKLPTLEGTRSKGTLLYG